MISSKRTMKQVVVVWQSNLGRGKAVWGIFLLVRSGRAAIEEVPIYLQSFNKSAASFLLQICFLPWLSWLSLMPFHYPFCCGILGRVCRGSIPPAFLMIAYFLPMYIRFTIISNPSISIMETWDDIGNKRDSYLFQLYFKMCIFAYEYR